MIIYYEDAIVIIEMARVCDDEGIGPEYVDLLSRIVEQFPSLKPLCGRLLGVTSDDNER